MQLRHHINDKCDSSWLVFLYLMCFSLPTVLQQPFHFHISLILSFLWLSAGAIVSWCSDWTLLYIGLFSVLQGWPHLPRVLSELGSRSQWYDRTQQSHCPILSPFYPNSCDMLLVFPPFLSKSIRMKTSELWSLMATWALTASQTSWSASPLPRVSASTSSA